MWHYIGINNKSHIKVDIQDKERYNETERENSLDRRVKESKVKGGKMDCEVFIMQVSGHPSVSGAPHNRWQTHLWWVPA